MKVNMVHFALFGTVCIGTLSLSLIATADPSFLIQYGVDRVGMDYRHFAVNRMEDCLNACTRDGQCQAFTYVPTGYQPPDRNNPQPLCWLKGDVPSASRQPGMVSGVRQ